MRRLLRLSVPVTLQSYSMISDLLRRLWRMGETSRNTIRQGPLRHNRSSLRGNRPCPTRHLLWAIPIHLAKRQSPRPNRSSRRPKLSKASRRIQRMLKRNCHRPTGSKTLAHSPRDCYRQVPRREYVSSSEISNFTCRTSDLRGRCALFRIRGVAHKCHRVPTIDRRRGLVFSRCNGKSLLIFSFNISHRKIRKTLLLTSCLSIKMAQAFPAKIIIRKKTHCGDTNTPFTNHSQPFSKRKIRRNLNHMPARSLLSKRS